MFLNVMYNQIQKVIKFTLEFVSTCDFGNKDNSDDIVGEICNNGHVVMSLFDCLLFP